VSEPQDLEGEAEAGGRRIYFRPIRPEDEAGLHAFFAKLSPEDVRMRFLQPLKQLPQTLAGRLSRIDPGREMAVLAFDAESNEMLGVGRLSSVSGKESAEFAIVVRTDRQGGGLGHLLMMRILAHAWARGFDEVFGDVLAENTRMLELCRSLGAEISQHPADSTLLRAVFRRPENRSGA
jgi:acetyltransferase